MIKKNVLEKAVKVAKCSNVVRGKIGAVLFKDNGHIITRSCNTVLMGNNERTIHAEQFLLAKAFRIKALERYRNERLNILVVRWRKEDDAMANAKPCNVCAELLRSAGLPVYYSNEFGEIEKFV